MALLETLDLTTSFVVRGNFVDRLIGRGRGELVAVDGVSISVEPGHVFGIVGESGSGKTTLGRTILRLVNPSAGQIIFDGKNITGLAPAQLRPFRRRMQIIFQDPNASLNPAMTIGKAVAHPLRVHRIAGAREARRLAGDMLERVGLSPASRFLDAYPADLSGGQKQRVVIARALVTKPEFIVADEPVSMLDMSVRAKILSLLLDLKREFDLTYLFITHDLATAKFVCDEIAIMYLGQIIEKGPSTSIYARPRHPYTEALLSAIPNPDPGQRGPKLIPRGEIPDATVPPLNCRFHPRCPKAFGPCGFEARDLVEALEHRWTRISEEDFEEERKLIGPLNKLRATDYVLQIPARGRDLTSLVQLFEKLRRQDDHKVFEMIRSVEQTAGQVVVQLEAGRDPVTVEDGGVKVACHLYPIPK